VFVAVDFEREDLAERLAAEGHDSAIPTAWIWEGVTPYLERQAVEASLVGIGARSAPRSTLLMTYVTPGSVDRLREFVGVVELCLRAVGEPLRSRLETSEAHALAAAQGFRVASDEGPDDWARRWLDLQRPPVVGVTERLLEAVRPALAA
jgi:methyltransferase (TIGR00027 family)